MGGFGMRWGCSCGRLQALGFHGVRTAGGKGRYAQRTVRPRTVRPRDGSSKRRFAQGTVGPRDSLPKGRFAQGTVRPRDGSPRDGSPKGRFAQETVRPRDGSPKGRFAHVENGRFAQIRREARWTVRPQAFRPESSSWLLGNIIHI